MTKQESTERIARAAAALREQGIDALLLTPNADQFYLTGFEHGLNPATLVVLVSDGLSIVDPVTLVERTRHKLGRPGRFGDPTNADRSRAVLPARGRVHLIDGTGATVATVTGIADFPIVAFLP